MADEEQLDSTTTSGWGVPASPPNIGGPSGDWTGSVASDWSTPTPPQSLAFDLEAVPSEHAVAEPARRSKGRSVAALGASAALLAAGGFGVWQMTSGNEGGADSPQAAVEALMKAANNEDAVGALDIMLPGERRTMKQPMLDMAKELTRLELLDQKVSMDKVAGLDIEITTSAMSTDEVGSDIANVTMSGTSSMSVDGKALPMGSTFDDLADGKRPDSSSDTRNFTDTQITTVKRGGRWYVSLFYSIAEQARKSAGLDAPGETGVEPVGGATPEEGMDLFLNSVADLSLKGMIASLNPDEAEALQRYAPLFLDAQQANLDNAVADQKVIISLGEVKYRTTPISDGRVGVYPQSLEATVRSSDTDADITIDGGCIKADVTMRFDGESRQQKLDSCTLVEEQATAFAGVWDSEQMKPVRDAIDTVKNALKDFKSAGITMVKSDGKWYVAPLGAVMDNMLALTRSLDKAELTSIRDAIKKAISSVDDGLSDIGGSDDSGFDNGSIVDEPAVDGSIPEAAAPAETVIEMCKATSDPDQCLRDAVDTGMIDEADVPKD